MQKLNKQHIYLLLIILILSIPNIIVIYYNLDALLNPSIQKKIAFFMLSTALISFPLLFLKPKQYSWLSILLIPFIIFEIFNLIKFKAPSSEEAISAIFYTNIYESLELLTSNLNYVIMCLGLIFILVYLNIKIKSKFKLTKKLKITLLISILLIFQLVLIKYYKYASKIEKHNTFYSRLSKAFVLVDYKITKIYPVRIFKNLIKAKNGIRNINNYKKTIKNFKYKALKKDTLNQQEIYVLVIGETARKHNFSLYDYSKKTNPRLANKSNLLVFNDVKSAANLTAITLPFLLTRATPNNNYPKFNEPAILNAFKEAGFKTYWITNQNAGLNNVFAFYSKLADYYINISKSLDLIKYDENLLPELEKVLLDKSNSKKFIIIHTTGSHFRYNLRYPKHYEVFKPTLSNKIYVDGMSIKLKKNIINSYDNSILYTDYILMEMINRITKVNSLSYLFYISDHGENLYDDENEYLLHGSINPTKYEIEIPLFIWNSPEYILNYPDKINNLKRHLNSKISSTNTFSTLLDMANISYKNENLESSFANKKFDTLQSRFLLTPSKKVIKLD